MPGFLRSANTTTSFTETTSSSTSLLWPKFCPGKVWANSRLWFTASCFCRLICWNLKHSWFLSSGSDIRFLPCLLHSNILNIFRSLTSTATWTHPVRPGRTASDRFIDGYIYTPIGILLALWHHSSSQKAWVRQLRVDCVYRRSNPETICEYCLPRPWIQIDAKLMQTTTA